MSSTDLVVCGAGPVGLVTALAARQRGLSVVVLEQCDGPPEKACGEGLMPRAVQALASLGVELTTGREFRGVRFSDAAHAACADFRGARGYAVRRSDLMRALHGAAVRAGVDIRWGHTLRGFRVAGPSTQVEATARGGARVQCSGGLLVAADGLRSPIRRQLALELEPKLSPRFGSTRHFRCPPWSDYVEVHLRDEADAYVTPVAADEVGVAILTREKGPVYDRLLAGFPELTARLRNAPRGRLRGAGPFEQRVRSVLVPGVALVGDAAGYLDALTGEGLAIGFRSALALVERFAAGELWRYPSDHERLTHRYRLATRALLELSARPALRRSVLEYLSRRPAVCSDLLELAADSGAPMSRPLALLRSMLPCTGTHLINSTWDSAPSPEGRAVAVPGGSSSSAR